MSYIPYTIVPNKIPKLFTIIADSEAPRVVSRSWLSSVGLHTDNDGTLLRILSAVELIDGVKQPTEIWRSVRTVEGRGMLAGAIKRAYRDIYEKCPDAHRRSAADIRDVVSSLVDLRPVTLAIIVRTFQRLVDEADFTGSAVETVLVPPSAAREPGSSLHFHISPDATPEQIDKIFESAAKHLYTPRSRVASE